MGPLALSLILWLVAAISAFAAETAPTCNTSGTGTQLANAAANLAVGSWCELPTNNISTLRDNGSSQIVFGYTETMVWDPTGRRIHYVGGDHQNSPIGARHKYYDEDTNTWGDLTANLPSGMSGYTNHGCDGTAIDQRNRVIYRRNLQGLPGYHSVYKYDIASATWTTIANDISDAVSDCGALAFHYELGLKGKLLYTARNSGTTGGVSAYDPTTGAWAQVAGGWNCCVLGSYDNSMEYNPVYKTVIWGGGSSGNTSVHRVNFTADGQGSVQANVTTVPVAYWGVQDTLLVVDPIGGDYIMLANNDTWWKYNPRTNVWTQLAGTPPPLTPATSITHVHGLAAAPINTRGVIFVAKCYQVGYGTGDCHAFLYKHTASTAADLAYQARAYAPGVINNWNFDDTGMFHYNWNTGDSACNTAHSGHTWYSLGPDRSTLADATSYNQGGTCWFPIADTAIKHTGNAALRIVLPQGSDQSAGGYFTDVFRRTGAGSFPCVSPSASCASLGATVYYQFWLRVTSVLRDTHYINTSGGDTGWKVEIWYGEPPNGASSSSVEITMNNCVMGKIPCMYGQQGTDDYGIQDVLGCSGPVGWSYRNNYTEPPCKLFIADQWQEFTGRIDVIGSPNAASSRVRLWVNGTLAIDKTNAHVNWGAGDGNGIGAFLFTLFATNLSPASATSTGYAWIDDLLISTQPIAMTGAGGGTAPSAPTGFRFCTPGVDC